MIEARWEHLEHGADIGVRGYGASPAEAFAQAALSLSSVVTEVDKIEPVETVNIACEAADLDLLLLDWLNEIIYQMAIRGMLFCRYEVEISNHRLRARLCGEAVDPVKHQPAVEIKGATFTDLEVHREDSGEWVAQCIIDV